MADVGATAGGKSLSYVSIPSYPARLAHHAKNNDLPMGVNVGEADVMDK